jgi:adenylate cyclase
VVVTVAHDVSGVEAEVLRDLLRSLGILGAVLGGALALAVWMAQKMVRAIAAISRAAEALSRGQYVLAEGVRTKDELEHLATAFNQAVRGLQERDQLKENFGKYVTRQVAEQILQGKPRLGGEMVPVTVFFADIRGFTSISEKMEPKALLDFLNLYFSEMVEVVLAQGGVVDKFIGDAIMAVFGAPVPHPDDALRAVRAALEMNRRLKGLNQRFVDQGLPEIRVGIGMHSGTVVAGNMGHAERMEYTVIGDPVNLASRLEGMTKELGVEILVSEDTYLKVRDCVHAEPLHPIRVRGRQQEVMVYRLTEIKGSVTQAA